MAKSSPVSVLKAYWFPLILFASSMFYQLLILPRSYPPSHYDVLGIKRYSSMEQVTEAYEKFSSKWNSGTEVPPITEFIKVCYMEVRSGDWRNEKPRMFKLETELLSSDLEKLIWFWVLS
ncbi:hypothetical protein ACSBR2_041873 [Camellia fascicularis]